MLSVAPGPDPSSLLIPPSAHALLTVVARMLFLFPQPRILRSALGSCLQGIAAPGAEEGSLRPVSDDSCWLSPCDPDPGPTTPDLEPVCQPTSLGEHAPPPPTLHSRSH